MMWKSDKKMWKSDKKNYFNAKIYKSIVLLNMLSKILKFIIFKCLQNVVKVCNLILNIQIRTCKHKSIDTTLQLITKKYILYEVIQEEE